MKVMRWAILAFLVIFALEGCGQPNGPLLSHGKSISHWLDELKKPVAGARKKAVTALGHAGALDGRALPALIGAVKDEDPQVRRAAIVAILNMGPAAKDAAGALSEAQQDNDPTIRSLATKALQRIHSHQ
jgi:HEAT repeat protein